MVRLAKICAGLSLPHSKNKHGACFAAGETRNWDAFRRRGFFFQAFFVFRAGFYAHFKYIDVIIWLKKTASGGPGALRVGRTSPTARAHHEPDAYSTPWTKPIVPWSKCTLCSLCKTIKKERRRLWGEGLPVLPKPFQTKKSSCFYRRTSLHTPLHQTNQQACTSEREYLQEHSNGCTPGVSRSLRARPSAQQPPWLPELPVSSPSLLPLSFPSKCRSRYPSSRGGGGRGSALHIDRPSVFRTHPPVSRTLVVLLSQLSYSLLLRFPTHATIEAYLFSAKKVIE